MPVALISTAHPAPATSVFVALAVVGDFDHGNKAYLCPPPRPEISNRLLDSCVDDQKNPSIFVIFEKNQIYPACILEYTCRVLSEVMIACLNHMNHTWTICVVFFFQLYVAYKYLVGDFQLHCISVSVARVKLQEWWPVEWLGPLWVLFSS